MKLHKNWFSLYFYALERMAWRLASFSKLVQFLVKLFLLGKKIHSCVILYYMGVVIAHNPFVHTLMKIHRTR